MSESRIQGVTPKEYKGKVYRSTLEANTAETLDTLGIPFQYESRKIILLEGFKCIYQRDKVRPITYTPDFILDNIMLECKGFETPEWRLKKKYVFKYLQEKEPKTMFYQIKNSRSQLLQVLDDHWINMGYYIQVTSRPKRKNEMPIIRKYNSVKEAMLDLKIGNRPTGAIMRSLLGEKDWVYGYNWKLNKIKI